jgi:NAD(P)-dependent dehydrogenase (short-subunit alcohol dehydrogenase family)
MTKTFSGQRVAIVGGTSGLGFATAQHLADEGADVIVVGRRNVDAALDRLPGAVGASVDVRDERALAELFAGVGGSAKDGVIELQGDHRDVVVDVLKGEGFDVVLAGG